MIHDNDNNNETGAGAGGDKQTILPEIETLATHHFAPIRDGITIDPEDTGDTRGFGVPDLDNRDWLVRIRARAALVRNPDATINEGLRLLAHSSVEVRAAGAEALGILGVREARTELEDLVRSDPDTIVRCSAANSLGEIGDPAAIPALTAALEREEHRDVVPQLQIARNRLSREHPSFDDTLRDVYSRLDPGAVRRVQVGDRVEALEFTRTDGSQWSWRAGTHPVVLVWVFADWCPVCHTEFHDLIAMRSRFSETSAEIATVECHDLYRCRVMAGLEPKPGYWFGERFSDLSYSTGLWWPHLSDPAGAVGVQFGIDPLAFAVHSEFINRPTTVVIDRNGTVRMLHRGAYWGDRPTIQELLEQAELLDKG